MAIDKYTLVFQGEILDIYKCYQQLKKENTSIVFSPADEKTKSAFQKLDNITGNTAATRDTKKTKPVVAKKTTPVVAKKIKAKPAVVLLCEISYPDYRKHKEMFTDREQPQLVRYKPANIKNANDTTTYRGNLYCEPKNVNKAKKLIGIVLRQNPKLQVTWL